MIDREGARAIAEQHLMEGNTLRIERVCDWSELQSANLYWTHSTPLNGCWFALVRGDSMVIESTIAVVVAKETGQVLGQVSLNDEG